MTLLLTATIFYFMFFDKTKEVTLSDWVIGIMVLISNAIIAIIVFKDILLHSKTNNLGELCKKAKYGIVKSRHIAIREGDEGDEYIEYYIDALFEDNTYIIYVKCNGDMYEKLSEGEEVLIVSFDNKTANAIIPDSISLTTEIKVNDLDKKDIELLNKDLVLNIIKKYKSKYRFSALIDIFPILILSPVVFSNKFSFKTPSLVANLIYALVVFGYICFLLKFIVIFKRYLSFKINGYKKMQYGTLKSKYHIPTSRKIGEVEHYFIDVDFNYESTYIRRVFCDEETYNSLNVGDRVAIISFDNRCAIAIKV